MTKVGWTLRWAEGLGRQSGFLALNAMAVGAIPFLDAVRPGCGGDATCQSLWAQLFFVPNLLFVPAVAATLWLWGSWRAQRRHRRVHDRYFASLEASETPEIPPGHLRPPHLERDLARRTLRGVSLGALLAAVALGALGATRIGRRSCDPVSFSWNTGLDRCSDPTGWSDALIAFQVWGFLGLSLLAALLLALRVRRYREASEGAGKAAPGRAAA